MYDSLAKNERSVPSRNDAVVNLVHNVNEFFNSFILHDEKHISLHENADDLIERAKYKNCPCQQNGHGCGIVSFACVLHLSERHPLHDNSLRKERLLNPGLFWHLPFHQVLPVAPMRLGVCFKIASLAMLRHISVNESGEEGEIEMIVPISRVFQSDTTITRQTQVDVQIDRLL